MAVTSVDEERLMVSDPLRMGLGTRTSVDAPGKDSDEVLAARGDTDSFVLLYRKHLGPIYGFLYARLRDRQEAEDVTSLAFERALTALPTYRPTGSFRAWLFTIAHRALADHYRHAHPESVRAESVGDTLLDPSPGPEAAALLSEQVQRILQIIAGLSPEQQEIITLRFIADLRYSEIATVMGKREAAVKMAAYRALDEIRRRYANASE